MTKKERQQKNCPGYYEVSGYTTKDGKHVEDYIRQCWKHSNGGGGSGGVIRNAQESIETTNEKLEEINNKETITDEDLSLSKGYLSATISKICEDCENYLEKKDYKTENPTTESIEKSETLDKTKDDILNNLEKSMSAVDKIEKIQKKKWDAVDTNDENYNSELQEYVKSRETIENINKNLRYLHETVSNSWGIANSYIDELKTLSNKITERGIPTGYAANIKNVDKEFDRPLNIETKNGETKIPNLKNYYYYNQLNKKLEKEVGNFLHENTSNPNFYGNDIRHQFVSAIYARNFGEKTAKWLGDLNELTDPFRGEGSGTEDSKIDKINNEIGRNYGLQYPSASREELLKILLRDWEANHKYTKRRLEQ